MQAGRDTDESDDAPGIDRFFAPAASRRGPAPADALRATAPVWGTTLLALVGWYVVAALPDHVDAAWYVAEVVLFGMVLATGWAARMLPRIGSLPCSIGLAASVGLAAAVQLTAGAYAAAPFKLAAAAFLASLLVTLFDRLSWVLVAAALITVTDIWSVYAESGVTNQLLEADQGAGSGSGSGSGMTILDALAVTAPAPGGASVGFLGIVDVVFVCLFVQVAVLWGLGVRRTLIAIGASFVVLFALMVTFLGTVPALPTMAIAFCIAHGRLLVAAVRDDLARSGSA